MRLPRIPPPYVGWFLVGLIQSVFVWGVLGYLKVRDAEREQRAAIAFGSRAKVIVDSLEARRCVVLGPDDAVIRRQPVRRYP